MSFGSINCGYCSGVRTIRKTISNNDLTCQCTSCGEGYALNLLPLQKKIIYLDQNFFSSACSEDTNFARRMKRLEELAKKQLIICPRSDVHDKETHLYKEKQTLWAFIKSINRGKRFYWQGKIKKQQIINAYMSFMKGGPKRLEMNLSDAIDPNVHDWGESLMVEVDWSVTNIITPDSIRQSKNTIADLIMAELSKWRASKTLLEDDYRLEIYDSGRIL